MDQEKHINFSLQNGLKGKFAVVKQWPDIKAAEDENIARIKIAARRLGLKCYEITPEGEIIGSGGVHVSDDNCDFVINLHFEFPKIYNVFSFVALWNPLKFYHDWGYERFTKHLLTHDDFLSCDSAWADDHVRRLISKRRLYLEPEFRLYHSISEPIYKPTSKKFSLFYVGINWERLGQGKSRHQELLDLLDKTGYLKIYGPKLFHDVKVWSGYKSYQGEIPFDGISIVKEIKKCGASLVLSSDAHKQSGLMSNRLFESLAAGALIICDENPFAKRHFGDSLLYIDTRDSVERQYNQIIEYLKWANDNPNEANVLAAKAQKIFLENFTLDKCLVSIYNGLKERKEKINRIILPSRYNLPLVRVFCLVIQFNKQVIHNHLDSITKQTYNNLKVTFVFDSAVLSEFEDEIKSICNTSKVPCDYLAITQDYYNYKNNMPVGAIIQKCIENLSNEEFFIVLARNEYILSRHIEVLVGLSQKVPGHTVYGTACLLKHTDGKKIYHDYYDSISFSEYFENKPNGFGRFLISRNKVPDNIKCTLPYLDHYAMGVFFTSPHIIDAPATIIIDIRTPFPSGSFNNTHEITILNDYLPHIPYIPEKGKEGNIINRSNIDYLAPKVLSLKNLSKENLVNIFALLLKSSLPTYIIKPIFYLYDKFKSKT